MSIKMFNRVFGSLVSAVLFASGCVSVQAEVPEVMVTQKDLGMEAVPVAGLPPQALVELMTERSVSLEPCSFPHGPIELPEGLNSNVRTVGVQLVTNRGIEDFSFIRKMDVTISDGKNPPLKLASFDRDSGDTTETNTLTFRTLNATDTLSMWQTEAITFNVDLTGSIPMQAWSMDVIVRFSGDFKYDL
jgi:hypothetical protein